MRTIRLLYRAFKVIVFLYGLWAAWKRSRWVAAGAALWTILRGRPQRNAQRTADCMFVSALEPAIYKRKGLRKLSHRTPV